MSRLQADDFHSELRQLAKTIEVESQLQADDFFGELRQLAKEVKAVVCCDEKYNPDQPRDDRGRWGSGGGGGLASMQVGGESRPNIVQWAREKFGDEDKAQAFAKWFGDSAVIDDNGDPLLTFHGTNKNFEEFKDGTHNAWSESLGVDTYFFTDNKATASTYTDEGNADAKIMSGYVSLQNPLEVDANGDDWTGAINQAYDDFETYVGPKHQEFRERGAEIMSKYDPYEVEMGIADISSEDSTEISRMQIAADAERVEISRSLQPGERMPVYATKYDGIIVRNVWDSTANAPTENGLDEGGGYLPIATVYIAIKPSQIKSSANRGTFDADDPNINKSAEKYNPDQPRDDHGRFSSGGGGGYREASTIKEAEEVAKQWVVGEVHYDGLALEAANIVNKELAAVYADYPGMEKLGGIEGVHFGWSGLPETADAAYDASRGLMILNTQQMGDMQIWETHEKLGRESFEWIKQQDDATLGGRGVEMKKYDRAVVDPSIRGAVRHEMGHHFDTTIMEQGVVNQTSRRLLLDGADRVKYEKGISYYASTSGKEYIAESFAAHWSGNSELANAIDPALQDMFNLYGK